MSDKKRIAIIGATSAIATHCARLWVRDIAAVDLLLVGRDLVKTEYLAADLRVRNPDAKIHCMQINFLDPPSIKTTVQAAVKEGPLDIVLIAHGVLLDQQQCQENLELCQEALMVNGVSPVLFAEAFAGEMQAANTGSLAVISSVAGERGRKSNYVYGAGKGLVTRYVQGLQHRLAKTQVNVVLIQPGPTDTPMTAQMTGKTRKLAPVEDVAQSIVEGIAQGKPVIYTPAKWRWIMLIIQHLPRCVFNKMDI